MKIVATVAEMMAQSAKFQQQGMRVGLVPTLGFLHDGHLALVRECVSRCNVTVVSVFVNPVQFGKNEDYLSYPRDVDRDCRLCDQAGADVVFNPAVDDMYMQDRSVTVREHNISMGLCGKTRPGHFEGVCTVVAKLLNIVRPDLAVFGQKDAQQLAVIRRMVRDLSYPVEITAVPIVRETDGLAMSSRNIYLSADDRVQAAGLNRVLRYAEAEAAKGRRVVTALRERMVTFLHQEYPAVRIDYITFVNSDTFEPVESADAGTLIALAAVVGTTRLIDNTVIT